MADASSSHADDGVDVDEQQKNLSKEQAAESKQLDTVTDFAEDEEMDTSKAQAVSRWIAAQSECMHRLLSRAPCPRYCDPALTCRSNLLAGPCDALRCAALQVLDNLTSHSETEEQRTAARELAAVQVKQDDIDMLAKELEISAEQAEIKIRQAKGDLKLAIANALL